MDDKIHIPGETPKERQQRLGIYPGWWDRNAETLLGCGCMGVLLLIGLSVAIVGLAGAVALLKLAF